MTFEIARPVYVYDGWYKIKSTKGFGFGKCKIHYFYHSKTSLCGQVYDMANDLILCEKVPYKKCKLCSIQLTRYNDLDNMIQE